MFVPNMQVCNSVSVFLSTMMKYNHKHWWWCWMNIMKSTSEVSGPCLTLFCSKVTNLQHNWNNYSVSWDGSTCNHFDNASNWSLKQKHLLFQHAPVFQIEPVQSTLVLCDRKLHSCGFLVSKKKTMRRRAMRQNNKPIIWENKSMNW